MRKVIIVTLSILSLYSCKSTDNMDPNSYLTYMNDQLDSIKKYNDPFIKEIHNFYINQFNKDSVKSKRNVFLNKANAIKEDILATPTIGESGEQLKSVHLQFINNQIDFAAKKTVELDTISTENKDTFLYRLQYLMYYIEEKKMLDQESTFMINQLNDYYKKKNDLKQKN